MTDPPRESQPIRFSWPRALLHSVLPAVLVVAVGATLALSGVVKDAEACGSASAKASFMVGLFGFGFSCAWQAGHKKAAVGGVLALLALFLAAGVMGLLSGLVLSAGDSTRAGGPDPASGPELPGMDLLPRSRRAEPAKLTDEDMVDLLRERRGEGSVLLHPHLRFTATDPGPSFAPIDEEMQQALFGAAQAQGLPLYGWGYMDEATGTLCVLELARGYTTRGELEGFMKGISETTVPQDAGGQIDKQEIWWKEDRRGLIVEGRVGPMHLRVRGLVGALGPDQASYLVVAIATGATPAPLDAFVGSLTLPGALPGP